MIDRPGERTSDADAPEAVEIPVITWVSDGRPVLMNDYEDPTTCLLAQPLAC